MNNHKNRKLTFFTFQYLKGYVRLRWRRYYSRTNRSRPERIWGQISTRMWLFYSKWCNDKINLCEAASFIWHFFLVYCNWLPILLNQAYKTKCHYFSGCSGHTLSKGHTSPTNTKIYIYTCITKSYFRWCITDTVVYCCVSPLLNDHDILSL